MSKMYIRVKSDGFIYDFNPILAKNPECEVVSEEVAYPERFIPVSAAMRVEGIKASGRKKKGALDLATDDIPEAPAYTSPELAEEASRGLPA
jgi:high-affinity K+ transport system ATPase subunit B